MTWVTKLSMLFYVFSSAAGTHSTLTEADLASVEQSLNLVAIRDDRSPDEDRKNITSLMTKIRDMLQDDSWVAEQFNIYTNRSLQGEYLGFSNQESIEVKITHRKKRYRVSLKKRLFEDYSPYFMSYYMSYRFELFDGKLFQFRLHLEKRWLDERRLCVSEHRSVSDIPFHPEEGELCSLSSDESLSCILLGLDEALSNSD